MLFFELFPLFMLVVSLVAGVALLVANYAGPDDVAREASSGPQSPRDRH